ncbi:MAG TPA: YciI family protein [Micropepsaceae bacterium]|nr:YciI family protein [Micropepsaceae bacterium]
MALFVISYIDKPNSLALRMANREAHLAYAHGDDKPAKVKLGGPYLDEKGDMAGSLIIVEAPSHADAVAFTQNDPYVKAGLFSSIDVRPYRVTVNKLA